MSCLSWTYRGLGSASTVKELPWLAEKIAHIVLCVLETEVHQARVEGLKGTLGFDNAFAVSSSGRSGGLGIFLNNNTRVVLLPYSQYHIDTIITESGGEPWRLTCVYGEAYVMECYKTWEMLRFIKGSYLLGLCIGDFNEVLLHSQHEGTQEPKGGCLQPCRPWF
jgi:hypothetical protein